eukprot:g3801.t1
MSAARAHFPSRSSSSEALIRLLNQLIDRHIAPELITKAHRRSIQQHLTRILGSSFPQTTHSSTTSSASRNVKFKDRSHFHRSRKTAKIYLAHQISDAVAQIATARAERQEELRVSRGLNNGHAKSVLSLPGLGATVSRSVIRVNQLIDKLSRIPKDKVNPQLIHNILQLLLNLGGSKINNDKHANGLNTAHHVFQQVASLASLHHRAMRTQQSNYHGVITKARERFQADFQKTKGKHDVSDFGSGHLSKTPPYQSQPSHTNAELRRAVEKHHNNKTQTTTSSRGSSAQPKSKLAKGERATNSLFISEDQLLRDIISCFQNLNGKYIRYSSKYDSFILDPPSGAQLLLSKSRQKLITHLCQLGRYHRHLLAVLNHGTSNSGRRADFVRRRKQEEDDDEEEKYHKGSKPKDRNNGSNLPSLKPINGLIRQAVYASIHQQLEELYRVIALFEGQLNDKQTPLTIRKLYLWCQEPLRNMKILCQLIDAVHGLYGGQILSMIYLYSRHGAPSCSGFVHRNLLGKAVIPLFRMVQDWLTEGIVQDPFEEFFVRVNPGKTSKNLLWREKYTLELEMIPQFFCQADLPSTILHVGKCINFLRECCAVDEKTIARTMAARQMQQLEYGNNNNQLSSSLSSNHPKNTFSNSSSSSLFLQDIVNGVTTFDPNLSIVMLQNYVKVRSKVLNIAIMQQIFHKFYLLQHLQALKRYLLLGQGDFIQTLMEELYEELDKPANQIFRHNLLGHLESAIRSTNQGGLAGGSTTTSAQDFLSSSSLSSTTNDKFSSTTLEQDILQRLDVRIHLANSQPGDCGWDVFTLDYHVDAPINSILNRGMMTQYLRIFSFLWRLKRVHFSVSRLWMRQRTAVKGRLDPVHHAPLAACLHKSQLLRNAMMHFVSNLHNYIMYEVLETSWRDFITHLGDASTIDDITIALQKYLAIIQKRACIPMNDNKQEMEKKHDTTGTNTLLNISSASSTAPSITADGTFVSGGLNDSSMRMTSPYAIMQGLFDTILRFTAMQGRLHTAALEVIHTNNLVKMNSLASRATVSIREVKATYQRLFLQLQDVLDDIISQRGELGMSLTSLTFRLDFNEYYEEKRKANITIDAKTTGGAHNNITTANITHEGIQQDDVVHHNHSGFGALSPIRNLFGYNNTKHHEKKQQQASNKTSISHEHLANGNI